MAEVTGRELIIYLHDLTRRVLEDATDVEIENCGGKQMPLERGGSREVLA